MTNNINKIVIFEDIYLYLWYKRSNIAIKLSKHKYIEITKILRYEFIF